MNGSPDNTKDISKQMEYVKQQEQLRALGNLKTNPKPLSADRMIEDLLSKKEIFQKCSPEPQQKQEVADWLSRPVPAMYSQVWASVQAANGLADTTTLSSLLMSSGLPTDTLAYIWSLANRTVPGVLTQQEVYLVLALVALTQTGYHITNLATVLQLPQAPVPALDLALLPPPRQQVYPTPLSVASLPDPHTYNWVASDTQPPSVGSDKINVSYVSSGPIVSPKLLTDNPIKDASLSFTDLYVNSGIEVHNDNANSNTSIVPGSKSMHPKNSGNIYTFSFPSLNESPSHVASLNTEVGNEFDDEFTDFQSADFTSSYSTTQVENQSSPIFEDDDEFCNFQKAPPRFDDDLSVLVIDGKSIPSAQTLWVAENPVTSKQENIDATRSYNTSMSIDNQNLLESKNYSPTFKVDRTQDKMKQTENKYDVFQEIDDDRFSVFHNPLPDDEDKHVALNKSAVENEQLETKSIFNHSLFSDSEQSSDFLKTNLQLVSMDFPKTNQQNKPNDTIDKIHMDGNDDDDGDDDDDDDEFSTFQNFSVSFPDISTQSQSENIDKYDVFRTIVFEGNSTNVRSSLGPKLEEEIPIPENPPQVNLFNSSLYQIPQSNLDKNESEVISDFTAKPIEDSNFDSFQEYVTSPENESNNIDSLFSSLAISDKTSNLDSKNNLASSDVGVIEDRYKALRLLEENPNETDEFGEFLVADVPNFESQPPKLTEKSSIQVRCLEACLNLLKDGLSTLSKASSQDVVSEVLSDPRASTYLGCLLEVHRVGERIISNMESDACTSLKVELCRVWDDLAPYFTHTEQKHLTEVVGAQCGVCRSNTGPSPVTFGAMTFHSPCANLYLHCVEPILPNIGPTPLVS